MQIIKMISRSRVWLRSLALVSLFVMVAQPTMRAEAQDVFPGEQVLEPVGELKVGPAEIRTQNQMEEAEATLSAPEPVEIPFRTEMSQSEYEAAKAAAAASAKPERPDFAAQLAPPTTKGRNFNGVNQIQSGNLKPPDTHGAVGTKFYCQIVNTRLSCYKKTSSHTRVKNVSLASFFNYFLATIFDPRIVYDSTWNRWVITAEAFAESATVQRHFIAISRNGNPNSPYFIYKVDVNTSNNNDFWDYPQLGMNQDAVIITANIFGPTSFREARMFAVAKARLYNGLGWLVPLFGGLPISVAPPYVLDQNDKTYLIQAPRPASIINKFTLKDAAYAFNATLTGPVAIAVPAYTFPPNARQPGTTAVLDTLDARFQNASTQIADSLFNVHTIALGPFPAPRWYEFDTQGSGANMVKQSGFFFASGTSDDFNPSIVANTARDVYVTYSSTDRSKGTNAQVRFSGRRAADPAGVIGAGSALFTSSTFYTGGRWGDYSAVTVDPTNSLRAWIVNEKINAHNVWGTRIGRIGY